MKKILILFYFISTMTHGQELIPIGTWRSHFNSQNVRVLEEANSIIYAATDVAILAYDRSDNSLSSLSKVNGLSDVGISAMTYNTTSDWLIIGYENGNIDLFRPDEVVNITSITTSQVIGSKRINHITSNNDRAFLSTDFGVVVLDLTQEEIMETYQNLGPFGESSSVQQGVVRGDSIFIATDFGMISGNINSGDNLLDFQNWNRYSSPLAVSSGKMDFVNVLNGSIVAASLIGPVFLLDGSGWSFITIDNTSIKRSVLPSGNDLLIAFEEELTRVSLTGNQEVIEYTADPTPLDVLVAEDGEIWIADEQSGLYGGIVGAFENFSLPGPTTNQTFKLYNDGGSIVALPGGYDDELQALNSFEGYAQFIGGEWQTIDTSSPPFGNLTDITRVPGGNLTIGSFGDGFLEVDSQSITDANSPGSPLQSSGGERATFITGVDFDSGGNLWVANYDSSEPLHQLDQSGSWTSFSFLSSASRFPISLEVNEFDDVWSILDPNEGGGILVFNAQTDQQIILTDQEGSGNLPSDEVTDVAFDQEGQAWIGTSSGIAFMPNPFNVFEEAGSDAILPTFENRPLLEEDYITTIAIDGGNRKWIGTREGLWLFSPAGDELIGNFNIENSPLPSNEIIDLEIDPNTGEVFISTVSGLVSYRGTSTEAGEKHNDVKIFPNPVRPGYAGTVGISGLVENAVVKITDVGGRLVREMVANGGTATWDTRDFLGNQASSGVYLVFSASADGDETFVGKIAVVR